MSIKLIIADDQDLVRDALTVLIQQQSPDAQINAVESFYAVLDLMRDGVQPDTVILDINMPGMNGLDGARMFIKDYPNIPLILMSGLASRMEIDTAFEVGVKGFIPKTMAGKSLVNAINLVISGEKYVHASIYESNDDSANNATAASITAREQDVLTQLFLGGSNKEIARNLDISEPTVKQHLRSLCDKLDARNRTDLIIKAIKGGYGG